MIISKTGFPEYIESIAIGPNIDFLKKNTSLCNVAEDFPVELQLAYKWKDITSSAEILPELRNYVKYLVVNGPELDTETLIYFTEKLNRLPDRFRYIVVEELENAFKKAETIIPKTTDINDFSTQRIDDDKDFLGKLSNLLKDCNSPCNYFRAYGDSIGTIFDISRNNNTNTAPSSADDSKPPATHIGMNIFNKLHTTIKNSYAEMATRLGAAWDEIKNDKPNKVKSDTDAYSSVTNIYSDALSRVKRRTQDCFRLYDYNNRYNAYDATMNLGMARNKFFDIALKVGDLERTTKIFEIDADGNIRNNNKPYTTAVKALGTNNIETKHDDRKTSVTVSTTSVSGLSATVLKGKLHFTTYGKYDTKEYGGSGGDTESNLGLGGSVAKPPGMIGAKDAEYKINLRGSFTDQAGNIVTPVALSRAAREGYGFTKYGETFTLTDSTGKLERFMYVDQTSKTLTDARIDIYDSTSTSSTAAQAASPANKFTYANRNANEMVLTKTGGGNYEVVKYFKKEGRVEY